MTTRNLSLIAFPFLVHMLTLESISGAAESNLLANGGFETAARLSKKGLFANRRFVKQGARLEGEDALLPARWTWHATGNPELRLVSEAHSGQRALRVLAPKGASATLSLSVIEVVPNATYSFGAWARGALFAKRGRIAVYGHAFEGRKELAAKDLAIVTTWAETRHQVTIPGHIRTVSIDLAVWDGGEVVLDDVFLSAELPAAYDPDAVLTAKPQADKDTLVLVDFDGQGQCTLESGAKITEPGGGRFGKGLRLDRAAASTATIPLAIERMPEEGTLECWLAPDDAPEHIYGFIELLAGDLDVMRLQADTSDSLRLTWRTSEGLYDRPNSIACPAAQSRDWFRKGQWHHVAVQWDKEAVRFFVNGVLAGYSTDRPLPFFKTPSAIRLGGSYSHYCWSGAVDEVRLSRVQRYGPFVPRGAKWTPFPVALPQQAGLGEKTALPQASAPREGKTEGAKAAPSFAAERLKLIGKIPAAPQGALSFGASELKPLLRDDANFKIEKDSPSPGMTTAWVGRTGALIRDPDNDGGYWKLGSMAPGRYFVGVWYESGKPGAEAPQGRFGAILVYLNGRILQLSTTSDPVQVAPGIYFAEAQTADAALLQPGDEIAVLPEGARRFRVARLTLYPIEPARGHGWIPENYGATWFSRDVALRLNLDAAFGGRPRDGFRHVEDLNLPADLKKAADGTRARATCRISNPLSVPLKVEYQAEVRAYFRELVGEDHATLTLQPHERITREIPFTLVPDSRRYTISAHARAVRPPSLGWPAADTISFFPGVRQSLPWPDAFTAKDERSVEFAGALPGPRVRFSLNGTWQSAFTASLAPAVPPEAGLEWKPRQVPFSSWQCRTDTLTPRPHGMYLRRVFTMPEKEQKKTYRLSIASVLDEGTVYVNGQKVGNVRGGDTPLVCDITAALFANRAGDNEILIVIRDLFAIMDPDYVNPASPVFSVSYLDAPGGGSLSGFGCGEVLVESSPAVAAGDLLVIPSVRKQELTARFTLTSHESAPVSARVTARVLDAGRPVLDLGSTEAALQHGQSVPLAFTKRWRHPSLWGPDNPKLYTLTVETVDAATGRRLDLLRERFGFRESWVDKDRLYFNGAPVRLKGSTCQGGGGVNIGDIQWSRGTHYPDFMDEFGYPVSFALAAIYNSSSRHNVERDAFWEAARRNVLAGAARNGNHPCIIAWDLSNEWLSFLDYGGGDPLKGAKRFKALDDALKGFDPSRWTFFDGDEDLHGLHDTFSTHYMLESTNPHPIGGFGFRGHSNYFPDGAFFRPLGQSFKPGQEITINVHRRTQYRYGEKPLMNTENLWKVGSYMPPGPSKFLGEDDVLGPAFDSGRGPIAWMWKLNLDGQRDLGVSALCNYTPVAGVARRGQCLQCFIMPDHTHHGFSGAKVERAYSLHNDLFRPSVFVFQWSLTDPAGKVAARGRDRRRMDSGDLQRGKLSFTAPDVQSRTRYALRLEILADGQFVYGEERDIEIWPNAPVPLAPLARKIVLYDPSNATAAVFRKAGIPFIPSSELTAPAGDASATLLVIGEGAVRESAATSQATLNGYVAAGGRVLVLAQDRLLPGLPVRTGLEPKEWVSMPFVRTPQHPALAGVTSWDLHFWAPDHVAAQGAYSKPEAGSFVTLVDSGTDIGLEWVQVMECYRGLGFYFLNQLPVVGKYDTEPMARELLARFLAYAAGEKPFRSPTGKLQVVASPQSPMLARLRSLGVSCEAVPPGFTITDSSLPLVDAAELKPSAQPPPGWKASLDAGVTVLIHGAGPEHSQLLSSLAGRPVFLTAQPFAMWEGRCYRNGFPWLTPGLSQVDLYWKRYDGSEGATSQAENPSLKVEDPVHYSASAEGAIEHLFPGGLIEIPVGKGRLIVDQVRWETANKSLEKLSARLVSAMMAGLGVAMEPYTPPRSLPREIAYKPLDLTQFANRGFADEVGDDGKGGWSDQGPDIDLRGFPTGRQSFGGVPFLIGAEPRCCIVLKSDARPFPERMPDDVTIPLGFPVEGLCFLHGVTYAGQGQLGLYQVQYADGSVQDIPLICDENIRDWVSPPALLPREKGTQSRIAWTGTTKVFPVVSVFQMLWINPNPGVPVKAVRFANPTRSACPILISLTAVVRDEKAAAARAAAQGRAKELLAKGLAAFNASQDAEARGLLQQATKEDPSLDSAHQALGQVCEKLKDEEGALAAYRAWADAGARTPLPYNRIGEILERRKDYKAALEAYKRSLQVEWNQPPVIEARTRLEKLLAQ